MKTTSSQVRYNKIVLAAVSRLGIRLMTILAKAGGVVVATL